MQFYARKRRQPPAIIIVALVDVLIVLLIFLMVTSTFKQQPALRLALPESSQAQKTGANENQPLIVMIDAQVAISADKAAPFGQIIKVMDAAKEAKIKMVNAFTKETGKQ